MSDSVLLRHEKFVVRRKVFTLAGAKFHIYDPNGAVIGYSKLKAFKLREDIRLYTGEDMQTELLNIQARQIIDFAAAYDVFDPATGEKVGALKRKGLKSILKDEWIIMDTEDREIGLIKEDSMALALIRRLLTNLVPQKYSCEIQGKEVATYRQHFNPFILRISVDFSANTEGLLDPRLGIAAAILLGAIEGRQN